MIEKAVAEQRALQSLYHHDLESLLLNQKTLNKDLLNSVCERLIVENTKLLQDMNQSQPVQQPTKVNEYSAVQLIYSFIAGALFGFILIFVAIFLF